MSHKQNIDIQEATNIHCVGIGGVGVSAVARLFQHRGLSVTGSDASMSPVVEGLREEDIDVSVGHDRDNVSGDVDLIVHSIAVPHDNPELTAAREKGIPTLTYPQTLGLISQNVFTIAVSGTHGKTTTTAMLADIFADSNFDPTVIVGSMLKDSHQNFVPGIDDMLVVEACEYKRSFLHLHPDVLVITNIDTDHLDYFDGLSDIQDAFSQVVENTAEDGVIISDPHDEKVQPTLQSDRAVVDYTEIDFSDALQVFGEHNKENGRAAVAAANEVGVDKSIAKQAVRNFSGTWRRAQRKGKLGNGALVFDDYGHHPTEIRSTLSGFTKQFPDRELIVLFQPHLFSRTKELLGEFAASFDAADRVIVLPIYAAREAPDMDISSKDLVSRLEQHGQSVSFAKDFATAESKVREYADQNSLVLTQGAGDVYEVADTLVKNTQ